MVCKEFYWDKVSRILKVCFVFWLFGFFGKGSWEGIFCMGSWDRV